MVASTGKGAVASSVILISFLCFLQVFDGVHKFDAVLLTIKSGTLHQESSVRSSSIQKQSDDHQEAVSESKSATSSENSEPQSYHHTWESMWRSKMSADSKENIGDGDVSLEAKEQLWKRISSETPTNQLRDLYAAFSSPTWQNSIAVYNECAYNELVSDLLESHQSGRNFTIVASGGSTTCGAAYKKPAIIQEERYYSLLAGYLNTILSDSEDARQTVQWIGQGHGARTSLHTAIFFDTFIPRNTDLLIWEFSINDAVDWFGDPQVFFQTLQSDLLAWLEEVGRMERPAKVMLVYYWNTPFHRYNATNKIVGQAFEAHAAIAREFDFVVGHVNLGSFIDEMNFPGCTVWETCPLLADKHHTSKLGHIATAYLLLNLMNPSKKFHLHGAQGTTIRKTTYEWNCGLETAAKQGLKQAVTDPKLGWKSSVGGWTLDLPAYNQTTSRRLIAGPGLGKLELVNKADPRRQDRKLCTPLKQCSVGTPFSVIAPLRPIENVQVVLLVFKRHNAVLGIEDINFYLNGSNVTMNGQLVPMRVKKDESILNNWTCHFSGGWSAFADLYWFVLETPLSSVHSVELCIPNKMRTPPKIQSVALW